VPGCVPPAIIAAAPLSVSSWCFRRRLGGRIYQILRTHAELEFVVDLAHIMGTRVQRLFLLSVVALSTSTGQRGTLPLFLQDGDGYSVGVPPRYHHGEETSALPCCTF
jgi:hypothetical protein